MWRRKDDGEHLGEGVRFDGRLRVVMAGTNWAGDEAPAKLLPRPGHGYDGGRPAETPGSNHRAAVPAAGSLRQSREGRSSTMQ